jgi:hypothetical protein
MKPTPTEFLYYYTGCFDLASNQNVQQHVAGYLPVYMHMYMCHVHVHVLYI